MLAHVNAQGLAELVTAFATFLGVVFTGINTFVGRKHAREARRQLQTRNGHTVGELVEKTAAEVTPWDGTERRTETPISAPPPAS